MQDDRNAIAESTAFDTKMHKFQQKEISHKVWKRIYRKKWEIVFFIHIVDKT